MPCKVAYTIQGLSHEMMLYYYPSTTVPEMGAQSAHIHILTPESTFMFILLVKCNDPCMSLAAHIAD